MHSLNGQQCQHSRFLDSSRYHWPRRITQVVFLFLFNLPFLRYFGVPCLSLNCYACPLATFACPIGSLQHFVIIGQFPFYLLGFLFVSGVLFGRFTCGWLCPAGLLQDLLHRIPFWKKDFLPPYWIPYIVLPSLVFLIPALTAEPWFSKLCPIGTLEAGIPLMFLQPELQQFIGLLYWVKIGILVAFILLSLICIRSFCRLVCPLGAIYSLFNKISFVQVRKTSNCTSCGACSKFCPTQLKLPSQLNSPGCIKCMECSKCGQLHLSFLPLNILQQQKRSSSKQFTQQ